MRIERLAIIGVGLIGGSLAASLRAQGLVGEVIGCGRSEANLIEGVELGVLDRYTFDPAVAARHADMVVVAVTLGQTDAILSALVPALAPHAVVTDVGSTKGALVVRAKATLGTRFPSFVPGHPIAGGERGGVAAARPELFRDHRVILTPTAETDPDAVARVHAMWAATGATLVRMTPEHHDEVLAATSHLPHMLAYALVDSLAGLGAGGGAIFDYAAGGFRDFTRIASSNPEMWRDIALENGLAIDALCARFEATLGELRSAIRAGDGATLEAMFSRARTARDAWLERRARAAEGKPV
jgi:prephenate dehydrogenase